MSVGIALALHGLLLLVPSVRREVIEVVPVLGDLVEVEAEAEPEAPPPPAPESEPVRRTPRADAPTPPPATTAAPPPPADEAVEELTGFTLTNAAGSFAIQTGNGQDSARPIESGVPTGRNTQGVPGGEIGGTPGGTGIVADADLSRRASAPSGLDAMLQRMYPDDARAQGIAGNATVGLEIGADGRVNRVQLVRESVAGYGFYRACAAMLRDAGTWVPAQNASGEPVASSPRFVCRFRVDG